MSHIGKAMLGAPVGQRALEAVPEMVLELEDIRSLSDDPWRLLYWASGGDFERYEVGLDDDPTIESYERLTELPERRLYRLVLSETGERRTLHPIAVEHDITIVRLTASADGQELLARFPSREAVVAFREACDERGRDFELLTLYEERPTESDGGYQSWYGVTAAQREALLMALEMGYFDIPRETTMAAIADDLGVSTSALSARLRRGQRTLLCNTLVQERVI